ncbi:MAG: flagellar basal body L-ring protein FlgH [Planctomycetes bacterium]|nr:flagellar basal body L-ring protein FlgH [Planctomycetota bacterium]
MRRNTTFMAAMVLMMLTAAPLEAQSSSLYVNPDAAPAPRRRPGHDPEERLSPSVASTSLVAVGIPEPHEFELHDLITIIIRESTESSSDATLDTTKESKFNGKINAFPKLRLQDLLEGQLNPGDTSNGGPTVGVNMKNEFKGDGTAKRSDTMTSRITATIIDIKPNGTLTLEARKHVKSDKEGVDLVLTGTCRKQDITADNSVLSTQLADLRIDKQASGELRGASKKGWLTKLFDGIFGI